MLLSLLVCLIPAVEKALALADVSEGYHVPQPLSPANFLVQPKKETRLVWHDVFPGSLQLPVLRAQKPSV